MSRPECVIPDTLSQVSKEFASRQLSCNGPYCHLNITDNAQPRPESDSLHNFSWKHSRQRQRREGVKNIQKGGESIVKLQSQAQDQELTLLPPMQPNHVNPLTKPRQPINKTTSTKNPHLAFVKLQAKSLDQELTLFYPCHIKKKQNNPPPNFFKKEHYYGYEIWHTKIRTWDNCHRDICACNLCPGAISPYLECFCQTPSLRPKTRS